MYYRLGERIEHEIVKHNSYTPKDFKKWAVICEHIIRHYAFGWKAGFFYYIEYWEIWNEADSSSIEPKSATWNGTTEFFYDFFEIVAKHLKENFLILR